MKEFDDDYFYIEKARCWMKNAGVTDVKYAEEFIKNTIKLQGCTFKKDGKSVEINQEKVNHCKDILYGLKFIRKQKNSK